MLAQSVLQNLKIRQYIGHDVNFEVNARYSEGLLQLELNIKYEIQKIIIKVIIRT